MDNAVSFDMNAVMSSAAFMIALAFVLAVVACYSYKILRFELVLSFSVVLATVGAIVSEMFIPAIEGVNINAAVGLVCGLIGAFIGKKLFKLCCFVYGAAIGYLIGLVVMTMFAELPLFQNAIVALALPIVCALVVGLLSIFIFKAVYIIVASVGGMTAAGTLIGAALTKGAEFVVDATTGAYSFTYPENNVIFILAGAAIGLIVGIIVAVNQFRNSYEY
jgi:hypothetical protein